MMAPHSPVTAPLTAPAAEILFQVMQKAMGGTALPTTIPMNRYTQPRDKPIFLQSTRCSQQLWSAYVERGTYRSVRTAGSLPDTVLQTHLEAATQFATESTVQPHTPPPPHSKGTHCRTMASSPERMPYAITTQRLMKMICLPVAFLLM